MSTSTSAPSRGPIQPELPVWLTSAGSPATFERAGTLGTNLLTHLLGQSIEQLAENVARYRAAWRAAGHPGDGQVTLDAPHLPPHRRRRGPTHRARADEAVPRYRRRTAQATWPLRFRPSQGAARAPTRPSRRSTTASSISCSRWPPPATSSSSGLFGTVDDAVELVERCADAGVDEIACLIDFGIDTDVVLESLPLIDSRPPTGRGRPRRRRRSGYQRPRRSGDRRAVGRVVRCVGRPSRRHPLPVHAVAGDDAGRRSLRSPCARDGSIT